MISLVIILPPSFGVLIRFSQRTLQRLPPGVGKHYLFVYGVLVSQCTHFIRKPEFKFLKNLNFVIDPPTAGLAPRSFAKGNRTLFLASTWCLVVVIFIYAYIGTLISFLSVPKLKPIISSVEDLPSSPLQWIVRKGSVPATLFLVLKCLKISNCHLQNMFNLIKCRMQKREPTKCLATACAVSHKMLLLMLSMALRKLQMGIMLTFW